MKKINNKGYMLVEIILAFSITFGLVYFIMDLVINLKNKNDDLLVETLVETDRTIITNKLMSYAISDMENEEDGFDCDKLKIEGQTIKYRDNMINIVNKYAKIDESNVYCNSQSGSVSVKIPLDVAQMKDENFDVIIDYKYGIGDNILPECSSSVVGSVITTSFSDNVDGSGLDYDAMDEKNSSWTIGEGNSATIAINSTGTYVYYAIDKANNERVCKIDITGTEESEQYYCPHKGSAPDNCYYESCTTVTTYCFCCYNNFGGGTANSCNNCNTSGSNPCAYGGYLQGSSTQPNCHDVAESARTSTVYSCLDGYTKVNDNYCYKVIE